MATPMRRFVDGFDREGSRAELHVSPHKRTQSSSRSPSLTSRGAEVRSLATGAGSLSFSRLEASPIVGSPQPSTSRLAVTEASEAEAGGIMRAGLEELRSALRDLQRQQRQAPRTWRTEIEAAVDAVQAKLSDFQRKAVDALGQDVREELDRRLEEARRSAAKRSTALEESLEASRALASSEVAALRSELSGAIGALAKANPEAAGAVVQAYGQAQTEARLDVLQQQMELLKVSTNTAMATVQKGASERLEPTLALERRAEAIERRTSELDSKLQEQVRQLEEQLRALKQVSEQPDSQQEVLRQQFQQMQNQLEDLRGRSSDGFRASAASLASLEASSEALKQRTERGFRESEKKLMRELEHRLDPLQASVGSLAKAAAEAVASEAEAARRKLEERLNEQMQQLLLHVNTVHETVTQGHESANANVSALLERVSKAEILSTADQSNRDQQIRKLEERVEEFASRRPGRAISSALHLDLAVDDSRSTEPMSPTTGMAKMGAQLEAHEKESSKLTRELQTLSRTVERLSEEQRRMAQEQAVDLSRQDASRVEDRRSNEKAHKKLGTRIEELELRMTEAETLPMELEGKLVQLQSRLSEEFGIRLQPPVAKLQDAEQKLEEQRAKIEKQRQTIEEHKMKLSEHDEARQRELCDLSSKLQVLQASHQALQAAHQESLRDSKEREGRMNELLDQQRRSEHQGDQLALKSQDVRANLEQQLKQTEADFGSRLSSLTQHLEAHVKQEVEKLERQVTYNQEDSQQHREELVELQDQLSQGLEQHAEAMAARFVGLEQEELKLRGLVGERLELTDSKLKQCGQEVAGKLEQFQEKHTTAIGHRVEQLETQLGHRAGQMEKQLEQLAKQLEQQQVVANNGQLEQSRQLEHRLDSQGLTLKQLEQDMSIKLDQIQSKQQEYDKYQLQVEMRLQEKFQEQMQQQLQPVHQQAEKLQEVHLQIQHMQHLQDRERSEQQQHRGEHQQQRSEELQRIQQQIERLTQQQEQQLQQLQQLQEQSQQRQQSEKQLQHQLLQTEKQLQQSEAQLQKQLQQAEYQLKQQLQQSETQLQHQLHQSESDLQQQLQQHLQKQEQRDQQQDQQAHQQEQQLLQRQNEFKELQKKQEQQFLQQENNFKQLQQSEQQRQQQQLNQVQQQQLQQLQRVHQQLHQQIQHIQLAEQQRQKANEDLDKRLSEMQSAQREMQSTQREMQEAMQNTGRELQISSAQKQEQQERNSRELVDQVEQRLREKLDENAALQGEQRERLATRLSELEAEASRLEARAMQQQAGQTEAKEMLLQLQASSKTASVRLDSAMADLGKKLELLTPRVSGLESTVQDLIQQVGGKLRVLDDGIMALEPRIQGAEREMPRTTEKLVQLQRQLEKGLNTLEPRLADLELEPWKCKLKDLEAQVLDLESSVVHLPGRVVELEAQAKSAEACTQELERAREALQGEQRSLVNKLRKRDESAEADGEAWREQLRIRSDALDKDLRQARADLLKVQEEQSSELQRRLEARLSDVESRLAEEEVQLKQGLQQADRNFTQRLDENQTALDRQGRTLTLLQHSRQEQERALEGLKRHVEQALQEEKEAREKEKGALAKAAANAVKVAEETSEVSKELMSRQAEGEAALLRRFEGWSLEAQEDAASKVISAQEASARDLLQEIDRRSSESEGKLAKIRTEVAEALLSTSGQCEAKLGDLRSCFTSFAAEAAGSIGEMSTHIERMRHKTDSVSVLHDSTVMPSNITANSSRVLQGGSALPGLLELRIAVSEEMRAQEGDSRRCQERLQEYGADTTVNTSPGDQCRMPRVGSRSAPLSRHGSGSMAVLEGLKGCEVAITTLDRRVTSLEDCIEDKLYDMVRGDLSKSQALQKGHLLEMENKVDKLVHQLHTPSGFQAAAQAAQGTGSLQQSAGDREMWRKSFRSALGDSLYVKKSLAKSNRSCSAETLRLDGCR